MEKVPTHYIKEWRDYLDFTQAKLAGRIETTKATVSRIETAGAPVPEPPTNCCHCKDQDTMKLSSESVPDASGRIFETYRCDHLPQPLHDSNPLVGPPSRWFSAFVEELTEYASFQLT